MGTVNLAEDAVLGRPVALKRLPGRGDPQSALRLKREALVGASLNHPNLVSVYDAQLADGGDVVIVMEYVEGQTLGQLIRSKGPLVPAEALRILKGAAAGLDAIHAQGIVHRDVKPANVLLGSDGAVKLADLGIADVADRTRITSADAVVGSFSYMSAEQLNGGVPSPAIDIYALSAVAYEMLTGERARPESNPLALAHAISTQPPPNLRDALPSAPRAAAEVLQRGMSADPARRPEHAGELVARLEAAYAPDPATRTIPIPLVDAPQARPAPRPRREPAAPLREVRRAPAARTTSPLPAAAGSRRRASRWLPALAAGAILVVAGIVVAALLGGGAGKRSGKHTPVADTDRSSAHHSTGSSSAHHSTAGSTHTTTHTATSSATQATTPPATHTSQTPTTPAAGAGPGAGSSKGPKAGGPPAKGPKAGGAASGTPADVVQRFYTDAAAHQYTAAWSLADANMQSQLGGYAAFQNQMSGVRSITFQQAQEVAGSSPQAATVAVRTTSVQSNGTQNCSGTARTVRHGHDWLLDGISINCT